MWFAIFALRDINAAPNITRGLMLSLFINLFPDAKDFLIAELRKMQMEYKEVDYQLTEGRQRSYIQGPTSEDFQKFIDDKTLPMHAGLALTAVLLLLLGKNVSTGAEDHWRRTRLNGAISSSTYGRASDP